MSISARLHVQLYGPGGGPLASRFDDVARRLMEIPRLHFEPDGSLLLSGPQWQVGGMLYDRDGVLQYVELRGCCPLASWQAITRTLLAATVSLSVLRLADQTLHDLQTFESHSWALGDISGPAARP
jgi:hypothetical protein